MQKVESLSIFWQKILLPVHFQKKKEIMLGYR